MIDPAAMPAAARAVFGDRLDLATRYAGRLVTDGPTRGLIGPREVERLWDRHLLNSAVLADLVPHGVRVVDVGTGAGLPGLPLAIRRPDLRVDLVEPMLRRVEFLLEVVTELELAATVRVLRGRADDAEIITAAGDAEWVVARAVAPLDRLVRWCLPLLAPGGRLLALKGSTAAAEAARDRPELRRRGVRVVQVRTLGEGTLAEPTWVIVAERMPARATRGGR